MPAISRFYGIVISMNNSDHPPPHFHARYGEAKASVSVATGLIIEGELPRRTFRLVHEWWSLHRAELAENWARFESQQRLLPIAPLVRD